MRLLNITFVLTGLIADQSRLAAVTQGVSNEPVNETTHGFFMSSKNDPGLTVLTADNRSCVRDFMNSLNLLRVENPEREDVSRKTIYLELSSARTGFGNGRYTPTLDGEIFHSVQLGDARLIHFNEHIVLVSSAESLHKTVQSKARFEGYYVLYPKPTISVLMGESSDSYLKKLGVSSVKIVSDEVEFYGNKEFYLFSVAQYADLTRPDFEINLWNPPTSKQRTSSYFPPISQNSGSGVTSRGTIYHFLPGGRIVIMSRRGDSRSFPVGPKEPISSHSSILRRQGVEYKLDSSPLELTYTAMEYVNTQLKKVPPRSLGVHQRLLDQESLSSWSGLPRVIEESAFAVEAHLPEILHWHKLTQSKLFHAQRERLRSDSYSFAIIRSPNDYSRRLFIFEGIHMQVVYAHLLGLALRLDEQELLSGGIFEVKYDDTGVATSISVVGNEGMMSAFHKRRIPLTDVELDWLVKKLRQDSPVELRNSLKIQVLDD